METPALQSFVEGTVVYHQTATPEQGGVCSLVQVCGAWFIIFLLSLVTCVLDSLHRQFSFIKYTDMESIPFEIVME